MNKRCGPYVVGYLGKVFPTSIFLPAPSPIPLSPNGRAPRFGRGDQGSIPCGGAKGCPVLIKTLSYHAWRDYLLDWENELTRMLSHDCGDATIAEMRKAISDVEIALEGRRFIGERIPIAVPPILQRGRFAKEWGVNRG